MISTHAIVKLLNLKVSHAGVRDLYQLLLNSRIIQNLSNSDYSSTDCSASEKHCVEHKFARCINVPGIRYDMMSKSIAYMYFLIVRIK